MKSPSLTIGIEEEYQIIDPETRELRSYITQMLEDGKLLLKEQVKAAMSRLERDLIIHALKQTQNNITHAARLLKISRKGLQLKMKELEILARIVEMTDKTARRTFGLDQPVAQAVVNLGIVTCGVAPERVGSNVIDVEPVETSQSDAASVQP